jgi:hypothetical protein
MPDDLLLELETTAPVAGSLERVEDLVREALRQAAQVSVAVEGMKGTAHRFGQVWRRVVLDVARGRTAEMHAFRPRLLKALEKRLGQLKHTHTLAGWLHKLGRVDVPDPDTLLPEIAGLERLRADVFERWQTPDDLEDLAARDYPLTTAELDQLGPSRKPPASYYAEEGKPF